MTDAELVDCINRARVKASQHGTMHAMWEVIFDAEAILYGKRHTMSRADVERTLTDYLKSE